MRMLNQEVNSDNSIEILCIGISHLKTSLIIRLYLVSSHIINKGSDDVYINELEE